MSLDGFLSVRELATEPVLAQRHLDDLPDLPPRFLGGMFTDYPVLLTDQLVLVSLRPPESPAETEEHLLLSARSLRYRSGVRYPSLHAPGSLVGAERPGRWLTHDHQDNKLRLWQVGGRLDDEPLPGQITLL
jgi:hypothetical protein